jgi:cytochrome b
MLGQVPDKTSPQGAREQLLVAVKVWDLPLRLFHWLLASAVAALVVTGTTGGLMIFRHGQIGLLVIGLLVLRLAWGFVGSTHARFATFMPTPARLRAYFRGEWNGVGHNPLGALSVLALLGVLSLQAVTGLFVTDDIAFRGPLYALAGKDLSGQLTAIHRQLGDVLLVLVGLHIAAIAVYQFVLKKRLVRAMVTGVTEAPAALNKPLTGGGWKALLAAVALAIAVTGGISLLSDALVAASRPPPAAVPDW